MSVEEELQEAAESGSLVIGTEETLKNLDSLDKVVLASNVPGEVEEEITEESRDLDVDVQKTDADNRQLGSLCMKPFSASVVGLE